MTWATEVRRCRARIDSNANGLGAILRANAGSYSKAFVSIDADCESGPILFCIDVALRSEVELVGAFVGQRKTDPTARLSDHEVDHLRRDELCRADQIAFVLAILVI